MALTNYDRASKTMELLRQGLAPFVAHEVANGIKARLIREKQIQDFSGELKQASKSISEWDVSSLLKLMWEFWNNIFRHTLGFTERSLVSELRNWRNRWAHQERFSSDDTDRMLDSATRLLTAVSAPQAEEVSKIKLELRRLIFDEQARRERRKKSSALIDSKADSTVLPWRKIVTPHHDVTSGNYRQAEFAADLWQVYQGTGEREYKEPKEFFRRTYLTENLRKLLAGAILRLTGKGGDPVVQLRTNFGGGKTHSMLALYHLFSSTSINEFDGVESILTDCGLDTLPSVQRAVIVGTRISPGNPATKQDGTRVCTLWGELAYQLGGKEAFSRIESDDRKATNPGNALQEIFENYAPCLVLIDEWVAYARQLHDQHDLPAGSFETQFTFAQALTETIKAVPQCLLVVALPASDTANTPYPTGDDIEVGGVRGREALSRLQNVIGRVESSWHPATAEESFEIVRRRLFEPLTRSESFKQRDVAARAFSDLYNKHRQEFPLECQNVDYEKRIRDAYPIHPEIFDRLYSDWSSLATFQRTRGVLRLMAATIHSLWEKGDQSPLILPAVIPLNEQHIQSELTRHIGDHWKPIIETDVDGAASLPIKIDSVVPNLGRISAARRVARTIYLGSAPIDHPGLEDRRINLGCVMPGESPAIFGDALRRLTNDATFLYQDGLRFWYATKPTVAKLARDVAERFRRDSNMLANELHSRMQDSFKNRGSFSSIHLFPASSADIPDEWDVSLVVLPKHQLYSKHDADSDAEKAAKEILRNRGGAPRQYRNALIFLAADAVRMQDLNEALCQYLAWVSILDDKDQHNLDQQQTRLAETQRRNADNMTKSRILETYIWLLVPEQKEPQEAVSWQAFRLSGERSLAERSEKRLLHEELLVPALGSTILREYLDRVPLWGESNTDHVEFRKVIEHFACYLYLPRLTGQKVLAKAVEDGVRMLTWTSDTFAFAESYDETSKIYRGLVAESDITVLPESTGLLVKSEAAQRQLEKESPPLGVPTETDRPADTGEPSPTSEDSENIFRRFYAITNVDPARMGRDAGRIAEEIISHLMELDDAAVEVSIEVQARIPSGASEKLIRTVTENSRALKLKQHGFEKE